MAWPIKLVTRYICIHCIDIIQRIKNMLKIFEIRRDIITRRLAGATVYSNEKWKRVCANETVSVSLENLLFSLGIVTFSRLSYRYIVGTSLKTVIKIVDIIHILSHTVFLSLSLFRSFIPPFSLAFLSFFSLSLSLPLFLSISHTELRILR